MEEVTLLRLLLRVVVVTSVIGVACSAPTTSLPGGNDAANDDEVNGKTDKAAPAPTSGAPAALPGDDDDDDDDSDAGAGDDDDDDDDDDDPAAEACFTQCLGGNPAAQQLSNQIDACYDACDDDACETRCDAQEAQICQSNTQACAIVFRCDDQCFPDSGDDDDDDDD